MLVSIKSRDLTKIAVFAALYAVLSFIPISIFIGAGSFLSLSLVLTPVIAIVFTPSKALICSIMAGLVIVVLNPGAAMFGIFTLLLPVSGSVCGSLILRVKGGSLLVSVFLLSVIVFYIMNRGSFLFWILPHSIATLMVICLSFIEQLDEKVYIIPFISTMCEQGTMLVFAIIFLQLPALVFKIAFPLMLYERLFATIGGMILILTIRKVIPQYIEK